MNIDKNTLTRRSICAATAFVLSVSIMLCSLLVTVGIACSKKYVSYIETESDYALLSLQTLKTELADLTIPGGFPLDFFDSRIDEALYKERVAESIVSGTDGSALSYSSDSVANEFYEMTYEYVLAEDGEVLPEVEDGLQGLSKECAKTYIKYSNPASLKLVFKYFPSIKKLLVYAALIVGVLLIASAVFLYLLCRGHDLLKHLFFSFSAAALLSGALPFWLLVSKEIKKISLTLPALHSFAVCYIEGLLSILSAISAVFLVASAVLAAIKLVTFIKANK